MIDREKCLEILAQENCSRQVILHCMKVAWVAKTIAESCLKAGINVNTHLVECGGLLHDIGRCRTHSIRHAVEGAEILKKYDLPRLVVRIVENHVGAGIPKEEAAALGLPEKDYFQNSIEEKIVALADKLVEGEKVLSAKDAEARFIQKFGESHPAVERFRKLYQLFSEVPGARRYVEGPPR